ncbi:MAG: hypothetical protein MHM6MM_006457 [Cercozoa sp. M6MM]
MSDWGRQFNSSSLAFCTRCQNLMSPPESDGFVKCLSCGWRAQQEELSTFSEEAVNRVVFEKVKPEFLKASAPKYDRALVNLACPECNHPEQYYFALQLRSVDEGQTIFYECPECGHKHSVHS